MELPTELGAPELVALVVLVVLLVAGYLLVLGGGKKGSTVLVAGPSGSGKTTLFHQLRDGKVYNGTVTSMEANIDSFPLSSEKGMQTKPITVVDLPGHPRLRHMLEQSVSGARGVIFLVDSADFMPHIRGTAEYLYDVLSHPVLSRSRTSVLIACNKSDLGAKAHTIDFIRKKLEKEVELLRSTRGTLEGGANHQIPLVNPSELFSFANCKIKIKVEACSGMKQDLGSVESFVRSCVPP